MNYDKYLDVCNDLDHLLGGKGRAQPTFTGDSFAVTAQLGDRQVHLVYLPERDPDCVHLVAPMGCAPAAMEDQVLAAILDANARLIAAEGDPFYARELITGEFSYSRRFPLQETADALLWHVRAMADAAANLFPRLAAMTTDRAATSETFETTT